MKKIYVFTTVCIIISIHMFAQDAIFKLTPEGFVSASDDQKKFVVLSFDGKSQQDLYKQTLVFFNTKCVSENDHISTVENESISISSYAGNTIHRNSMHVFDMDYTISFLFKDGKIRIDAPNFKLTTFTDKLQTLHLVFTGFNIDGSDLGIYGKEGKVKSDRAITDLEAYFNAFVALLKTSIESGNGNSSW